MAKQAAGVNLNEALVAHAMWIETNGRAGSQLDLSDTNLSGANLSGADLTDASLNDVKGLASSAHFAADIASNRHIVVITGSRSWEGRKCYDIIQAAMLQQVQAADAKSVPILFVLGCAKGVDGMAQTIVQRKRWNYIVEFAEWNKRGRSAGPERNARVLSHNANLVLAFSDTLAASKGTANTVKQARAIGTEVIVHETNPSLNPLF